MEEQPKEVKTKETVPHEELDVPIGKAPEIKEEGNGLNGQTKKPKLPLILAGAGLLIVGVIAFFIIKGVMSAPSKQTEVKEESMLDETLPSVDSSITVTVGASKTQENAILITIKGLGGKMVSIGYEIQYESEGVSKGVTSGSKPIDVTGQDMFERDIYLGTCSKNVCKPDVGVEKISLVLEFTDINGKRSQFVEDYEVDL